MSNLIEISRAYFKAFSLKDLKSVSSIFDENITLRDWNLKAIGKTEVIEANKKIFQSVNSIKVNPLHIDQINKKIYAEIDITIDQIETIKVLDIIEFNDDSKMLSIRAYKG